MENKKKGMKGTGELRRKAEERLKFTLAPSEKPSELETQELIQELQVHQIELEMQNENLRMTQAVLEESRAKYSDLYDFAPVGYLTLNRQGLILEANLTACSKLGKERSLLISINALFTNFIIEKGEKDLFYQHLRKVFEGKSLETCDLELNGKDNTIFYAQLESIVVKNNSSQCRIAMTDITARKKAEKELKKIDQLKTDFIGTVSHELRTPLTVIGMGISNLKDGIVGPISQDQSTVLERNHNNVKRLGKLINNLLDLSRLESGRANIQQKELNLNSLIHEVLQSFQEVEEKFMKDLPEVEADPDMISQVLVNLLSNAVRYTKKQIVVSTRLIKNDVETSVFNDGPGIPRENMDKLFEKFVQLDRVKNMGSYKGTGLGLAICKEIIEKHRGKIWVESEGKTGVKFCFTLPIRAEKETKDDK